MKKIPSLLLLISSSVLGAQNLVVNPGFEIKTNLHTSSFQLKYTTIPGWTDPSGGSCDIKIAEQSGSYSSRIQPDSGRAWCGMFSSRNGKFWAEYVQGELLQPLIPGKIYRFAVSILNNYPDEKFIVDNLGVSFSRESRTFRGREHRSIRLRPDFDLSAANKTEQTNGWTRCYFDFTAQGEEQYFIIGTFTENGIRMPLHYGNSGYVNLDNFSVTPYREPGPIPDWVFANDSLQTGFQQVKTQSLDCSCYGNESVPICRNEMILPSRRRLIAG